MGVLAKSYRKVPSIGRHNAPCTFSEQPVSSRGYSEGCHNGVEPKGRALERDLVDETLEPSST